MASVVILKKPVFVDFDRRREVVFNLNTEILIKSAGGKDAALWETIGKRVNSKTHKEENILDVNLENLRLYLWAALQHDARRVGEALTIEDVGALLVKRRWVTQAVKAISEAMRQYYGDDPQGEANAPAGA